MASCPFFSLPRVLAHSAQCALNFWLNATHEEKESLGCSQHQKAPCKPCRLLENIGARKTSAFEITCEMCTSSQHCSSLQVQNISMCGEKKQKKEKRTPIKLAPRLGAQIQGCA